MYPCPFYIFIPSQSYSSYLLVSSGETAAGREIPTGIRSSGFKINKGWLEEKRRKKITRDVNKRDIPRVMWVK